MAENRTQDDPIKALLIEDNPGDAKLIQLTMADNKPQPIRLEIVDQLSSGCKRLAEGGIDVILLDLSLPDGQGFDTLVQVQAAAPNVPVVVLTGLDNDEIGLEAVSKGAQDYLVKGQVEHNLLARALRYAIERKRAETALREAEQHYRSLFEGMPIGLYRTTLDGRILDANSAMARILGYLDREILMAQNVGVFYIDPQIRAGWRSLADSREGEVDSEIQVLKKDGAVVWLRDTGHAVRDARGQTLYYEGALEDITGRKRAEEALRESEDRYRLLVDKSPYAISVIQDESLIYANPAALHLLGATNAEDLLGKSINNIIRTDTQEAIQDQVRRMLQGETSLYPIEDCYVQLDGRVVPVEITAAPFVYQGRPAIQVISLDITERWRMAEMLRLERDRAQKYLDVAGVILVALNHMGEITLINKKGCNILGYEETDIVGKNWFDTCLPASAREEVKSVFSGQFEARAEKFEYAENCVLTKSGEIRTIAWHNVPLVSESGEIIGTLSSGEDITERKQAEEALANERTLLRTIIDILPVIVYAKDTACRKILTNHVDLEYMRAATEVEALGKTDFDFYPKEIAAKFYAHDQTVIQTGQALIGYDEPGIVTADGLQHWLLTSKVPLRNSSGQIIGLVGIGQDITERKRAEETLKQYTRQLLLINDISRRVASVMDLDELLDTTASLIHESFGYEHVGVFIADKQQEGELVMKARAGLYASRFASDHRMKLGQGMVGWVALYGKRLLANDVSTEMRFRDPFDDESIKAELSVPIRSEQGNMGVIDIQSRQKDAFDENDVMVVETLADVLAVAIRNVRLHQELEDSNQVLEQAVQEATVEVRRTKERVEAILDNSPDAILLLRGNGTIEAGNPAFQELFGYHIDDLYGKLPTSLVEPGHADSLQDALTETIDTHERRRLETIAQRLDGSTFDADIALSPIKEDNAMQGIVCSIRDITATKEIDRMKDAFISNVSHELRTPITGIKLSHRLIGMDPEKQPIYMERMGREIERLHDIIENLLRLSRLDQGRTVLDIKPLDLNALAIQYVSDRTPLAQSKQLTLSLNEHPGLPFVQADEGLIGQVLSILLTNALSYTPSGGEVMVSTRMCETGGRWWAGFSVNDTGPGIPANDLPHLGERFYRGKTGRDSGAPGTGLGLAIAREIIERHHGRMEISNGGLAGTGAAFTIWLPTERTGSQESNAEGDTQNG